MKRWIVLGTAVTGTVGLIAIMVAIIPPPALPPKLVRQSSAAIFVPVDKAVAVDRESARYQPKLKMFSYAANTSGTRVVFSQQPTPETFIDVPQVYDKVVANMNQYKSFETPSGTVHLTRPKEGGAKQTAVLNSKGTLLFAKADRDLPEDAWRRMFVHLKVQE